jgi:cob(I)alamin adenosyltransferase
MKASAGKRTPHAASAGQVHLYVGGGKGKTSAAFGVALRAAGHGMRIAVIQFMKGITGYGEVRAARLLRGSVSVRQFGRECAYPPVERGRFENCGNCRGRCHAVGSRALRRDRELARRAISAAKDAVKSRANDIVVLDEALYAVKFGLVTTGELLGVLAARHPDVHVILTGNARIASLEKVADTVTRMMELKHHLARGVRSVRGIDR